VICAALLGAAYLILVPPVFAGQVDGETGKRLAGAQDSLAAARYDEARDILAWLNPKRLNLYEQSRVEQLLAGIDQAEGNLSSAREHLQAALATNALSDTERSSVQFQIGQLYMAEERWREGANTLGLWLTTAVDPKPAAYYLLAIAYYQLQELDNAVPVAQKAVDLTDAPQENWLQLLLALRIQREEYEQALPVLTKLVGGFPEKKAYWLQLSSVDAALGRYEDAAATLQLAERAGLLTDEQDIRRLAELLAHVGIPYRGGQMLEVAMTEQQKFRDDEKTRELLANCWIAAREYVRAVPPLAEASQLSQSGDLYVRLAQVHVQLENWENAGRALEHAIDKGNLGNPANAELLLGIAYYSEKQFEKARPWFERASANEAYRAQAEGWIKQIDFDLSQKS
jgi:tetratricopeptide (TPR) repeat protein